ncbi:MULTISPECIES: MTH1187 family thiamine-binding protein [Paenibacillus]|uniref:MTH1187 family thiamine-binding protein n=1 Tax=Paenibacillus polymyxa TaxID=1406 RepID=A0AAE9L755_PAEPO|nr:MULTISPECIES: MTH1187 family thiamine-binding protein [Paenibacillus]MCF2717027.1 MTH1187 family thiamine-binding protein [Paenibacillus sp. UKAQ_18]MCP3779210.1 MTH1187 family thiamine-binding protein [Paenibacillus sp. MZ03-122A]MCP3808379.1 MTH1187 family thiamine-binding protein [Paenibacillus sp. Lou8.1]URJ40023.1 MTH1187 family thiamine-binding protein [Paenibacillus polymyxa]URJ49132.1 MTH1187 family thiamine-binding protein [Paenibacillus polymyxa]
MANTLLSIQVIPKTPNNEDSYPYVDKAIEVIQRSGVKYQVNPLDTTMEGELDELLKVVKEMHEALTEAGSPSVISQIKIAHNPQGISMNKLTEKYRP